MIRTKNLTRRYGDLTAVSDLNLHVRRGTIYGLFGPNGAGKTTIILMLLNILPPTRGHIRLFDLPLIPANHFAIKRRIGVVGETQHCYDDMTAREYLRFFADLNAVRNASDCIESLMDDVGLADFLDVCARDYSPGMKKKLALVRALLPDPDLLILDEPASDLDPNGIQVVRRLVQAQNDAGKTVFISSHILSDIESTAQQVGIIHQGRLLAEDTIVGLHARLAGEWQIDLELSEPQPDLPAILARLPFVRGVDEPEGGDGRRFAVRLNDETDARARLSQAITAQGGIIVAMRPQEMGLEKVRVTITEQDIPRLIGRGAREAAK